MKLKHGLIILVVGYCFDFIGSVYKISHWANADIVLLIACGLKISGCFIILSKLLSNPKLKDIFDR